jgi:BlaI family transcriptional regulator, penicillinase repressor
MSKSSRKGGRPSDAELAILKVLWHLKSATAKEMHQELNAVRHPPRVLTTTAKLLQIMMGKNLVARDESTWPHMYHARAEQ